MTLDYRLHIAGIPPTVTAEQVKQRFSSFGSVTGVEGVGKLDGNGFAHNYCFLNITATQQAIKKCSNLLNGSIWAGQTLRITPAKPDYLEIREKEMSMPQKPRKVAKKRLKTDGIQAADATLTTADNAKDRKGWKVQTSTSTPIFPLVTRPSHPIPPPKTSRSAKRKLKQQPADDKPTTRARLTTIDPTAHGSKHFRESFIQQHVAKLLKTTAAQKLQNKGKAKAVPQEQEDDSSESDSDSSSDAEATTSPAHPVVVEGENEASSSEAESSTARSASIPPSPKQSTPIPPAHRDVQLDELKEIFKPQEATTGGFSLGDLLGDAELDETMDFTTEEPAPVAKAAPVRKPVIYTSSQNKIQITNADYSAPLFFPFPMGINVPLKEELTEAQTAALVERSWNAGTGRRFRQTRSAEEIEKNHEQVRKVLNEQIRKRHREAVKRKKQQKR